MPYLNSKKMQQDYELGERERFVTFAGFTAVGLSGVEKVAFLPDGIDPESPNVWSFILNPWRGKGIGTQVMSARMRVVDERFNGIAATVVRPENKPSQKSLKRVGFVLTDLTADPDQDIPNYIFTYRAAGHGSNLVVASQPSKGQALTPQPAKII